MTMKENQSQLKAIQHNKGPMLVLAGPGSGKTLVITKRTQNLIEEYGVNPRNILVITFTKAAANEMRERFSRLTKGSYTSVSFGTFHAIFFTILKYAYNFNGSNILKDDQKYQYFREIIEQLKIEVDDEKDFILNLMSEVSLVKGERMDLDHYYSINCSEEVFKKVYRLYDNRLRSSNLIDFDDMLSLCYELLIERKDILALWQKRFQYILIDEFQDINKVQYDIIKMLALPENNLFIVGDDDQSIYRFRGAKPEIMLNFSKNYPECSTVLLDTNYRSTSNVVRSASNVIKNNKHRFPKKIYAMKKSGTDVSIETFPGIKEENESVVSHLLNYQKVGVPFSDMAVLFRTNTQPRALLEKIMEYNIPFYMKDMIPNIYEHWISKNIFTYINLAMGHRERGLFLEIINRPKRYVRRECFSEPIVDFLDLRKYYGDKDWMLDRIDKLEYDLKFMESMSPFAAINYIRKGIGYDDYLKEYASERKIGLEELLDTLNELQESSRNYKTYEEWFLHIKEYKEELKKQERKEKEENKDCITMATMHSSKGLEYQVVFIIDANEGIMPHHKSILDEDIEEERRLFYVAMTRAKEYLHIYNVKERYNKELSPSRFVGEILIDIEKLKPGIKIEHKTYGSGKIKYIDNKKIIIYFDKIKKDRTLDLQFSIQNCLIKVIKY